MSRRGRRGSRGGSHGGGGGRQQDRYARQAKKDGYPARSVYKLQEINEKTRLLRRGQRVLDLGASPGSWTLYAAEQVGREGRVLGLDIQPHRSTLPNNAEIIVMDVHDVDVDTIGEFDLVLTDMAPNTTGVRDVDMYRSYELFMTAVHVADKVLVPGGHFAGKIFQGKEFPDAQKAMRERFGKVKVVRPKAVRDESYEVFLVGLGRKKPPVDVDGREPTGTTPAE